MSDFKESLHPLPSNVTTIYDKNQWTDASFLPSKSIATQTAVASALTLLNPESGWTAHAYRASKLPPHAALEIVFYSDQPPILPETVWVKSKKQQKRNFIDQIFKKPVREVTVRIQREKNFLDLRESIHPNLLQTISQERFDTYRESPTGLIIKGTTIFPILSLEDHLKQALNPNSKSPKYPGFIPWVYMRAFPLFDKESSNPEEPVGENRKRLFMHIPIFDVRPVMRQVAEEFEEEQSVEFKKQLLIKKALIEKLREVERNLESCAPDRATLSKFAFLDYALNLTGNRLGSG